MTAFALAHPLAGATFRSVAALGYRLSVFDLPASFLGAVGPAFEAHAVDLRMSPAEIHVVKVYRDGEDEQALYRLACALAESVGIDPE